MEKLLASIKDRKGGTSLCQAHGWSEKPVLSIEPVLLWVRSKWPPKPPVFERWLGLGSLVGDLIFTMANLVHFPKGYREAQDYAVTLLRLPGNSYGMGHPLLPTKSTKIQRTLQVKILLSTRSSLPSWVSQDYRLPTKSSASESSANLHCAEIVVYLGYHCLCPAWGIDPRSPSCTTNFVSDIISLFHHTPHLGSWGSSSGPRWHCSQLPVRSRIWAEELLGLIFLPRSSFHCICLLSTVPWAALFHHTSLPSHPAGSQLTVGWNHGPEQSSPLLSCTWRILCLIDEESDPDIKKRNIKPPRGVLKRWMQIKA